MTNLLVVVPCGRRKIWDKQPWRTDVPARDAYTGASFQINRAYAERFAAAWVILSAKYGFLAPDATIPESYNVTFKDVSTNPVSVNLLQEQIGLQELTRFGTVIALGGKVYRSIVEAAFASTDTPVATPFVGLPIGKYMQAVKRATASGEPIPGASNDGPR